MRLLVRNRRLVTAPGTRRLATTNCPACCDPGECPTAYIAALCPDAVRFQDCTGVVEDVLICTDRPAPVAGGGEPRIPVPGDTIIHAGYCYTVTVVLPGADLANVLAEGTYTIIPDCASDVCPDPTLIEAVKCDPTLFSDPPRRFACPEVVDECFIIRDGDGVCWEFDPANTVLASDLPENPSILTDLDGVTVFQDCCDCVCGRLTYNDTTICGRPYSLDCCCPPPNPNDVIEFDTRYEFRQTVSYDFTACPAPGFPNVGTITITGSYRVHGSNTRAAYANNTATATETWEIDASQAAVFLLTGIPPGSVDAQLGDCVFQTTYSREILNPPSARSECPIEFQPRPSRRIPFEAFGGLPYCGIFDIPANVLACGDYRSESVGCRQYAVEAERLETPIVGVVCGDVIPSPNLSGFSMRHTARSIPAGDGSGPCRGDCVGSGVGQLRAASGGASGSFMEFL